MTSSLDHPQKLSYEEYWRFPDDGRRHEIIDGTHYVNPSPETFHQTVSRRIQFQLYRQIEETGLGEVFNAPVALQLSDHDVVEPDLLVVLTAEREKILRTKIEGPPSLVAEILSPSNRAHDRRRKFDLYERAKIPEYWIVDPDACLVEQFTLDSYPDTGGYRLHGTHKERVSFLALPNIHVDLVQVWRRANTP